MKTNRHLIISGILFTIFLFLWPVFMSISQPRGTVIEQFDWIQNNFTLYKLQFFFAMLISPAFIYLMVSQLVKVELNNRISLIIGLIFITGYFTLNTLSYASQIILVPKLLDSGLTDQAIVWYFNSSSSATYFINQMSYSFWGTGAIVLFVKFIRAKGMIKYISIIYIISSVLSIIAFAGLIIDNMSINSMTIYSGLLCLPIGIMTIIWGIKENRINN